MQRKYLIIRLYEYLFFKLYRWNKYFISSFLKIDDAIACAQIAILEVMHLNIIYNLLYYNYHFKKYIFDQPIVPIILWLIANYLNLNYFGKKYRYQNIYSKYDNKYGIMNSLGTLLVLAFVVLTIVMFFYTSSLTVAVQQSKM